MKKISKLLSIFVCIVLISSCNNNPTSEYDITKPPIEPNSEKPDDYIHSKGKWELDQTGQFSYMEFQPDGNFRPYFVMNYEFPDNMFIYESNTDDGKVLYGYMNEEFELVSEPISIKPNVFKYGIVRIQDETGSYIVNDSFNEIIEFYPGYFLFENSIMVVDWYDQFYREPLIIDNIDTSSYLVPYKIEKAGNEKTQTVVGFKTLADATSQTVNPEDGFVIPAVYQEANLFIDGLAAVKYKGKWGYIDAEGNTVIDFKYNNAMSLSSGVAAVYLAKVFNADGKLIMDNAWALFDIDGNQLTEFDIFHVQRYEGEIAVLGKGSRVSIFDNRGKQVIDYWSVYFDEGPPVFHDGIIKLGSHYYDIDGKRAFPQSYRGTRHFSDGLAAVTCSKDDPGIGYINANGEVAIPCVYSIANDFNAGYAYVREDTFTISNEPGFIIDKQQNKYLEELKLVGMTKFNEMGYALGYSYKDSEENEGWEMAVMDEKRTGEVYYIIRIESP